MADIFLSYARDDIERVRPLVEVLEARGWTVWWDRDIPKGTDFADIIDAAIEDSRTMVVVWSAASVRSRWVRGEARRGLKNGRGLLPVRLEEAEPPIDFRGFQETDLTAWDGSDKHPELEALIAALEGRLGKPKAKGTEDAASRWWPVASGLAIAALLARVLDATHVRVRDAPTGAPVRLGCSSPRAVIPGQDFTARFAAYSPDLEEEVRSVLHGLSPKHTATLGVKQTRWALGVPVTVTLRGRCLAVEPESVVFHWDGEKEIVEFDVSVPVGAALRTTVLKYDVRVAGLRLLRLRADLEISDDPDSRESVVQAQSPTTAFASYARRDQPRVFDMVMAMENLAGVEVFLDRRSIRSGAEWEPLLAKEIEARDLFMLFWSRSASRSYWVKREWQTAWKYRRPPTFQVYALEPKDEAPPPEELTALNFEDPLMVLRAYYEMKKVSTE